MAVVPEEAGNLEESFPVPVVLTVSGLSILGAMVNIATLAKVSRMFDTKRACLFLAKMDVALASTSCALFGISVLIGNLITRDVFTCSMVSLSAFVPLVAGHIITAQVSVLRYCAVRLTMQNGATDDKKAKRMCLTALAAYIIFFIFIKLAFGLNMRGQQICQNSAEAANLPIMAKLLLPIICPFLSASFDIRVFLMLRSSVAAETSTDGNKNTLDDTIPVRATLTATMFTLVYVGTSLVYIFLRIDPVTTSSLMMLIGTVIMAMRCPIMIRLTYMERERVTREAAREERQMVEMELARAAREFAGD